MGESDLHKLLKKIGMAWLYNQSCFMVADECYVYKDHGERHELDNHYFIDVLGVGKKYIPWHLRPSDDKYGNYYQNILRGIEVKISRSDFKNGFVTTGCNYHYLLTPMRLVSPAEIPKWVGLIEYNKHKYGIRYTDMGKFNIAGLRIVKKPRFRDIVEHQLQRGTGSVGARLSTLVKANLREMLCSQFTNNHEEVKE